MKILIVGSGAREHAIARALQKSPKQKTLYCLATNANPGLQELCSELQIIDINDNAIISQFARDKEEIYATRRSNPKVRRSDRVKSIDS